MCNHGFLVNGINADRCNVVLAQLFCISTDKCIRSFDNIMYCISSQTEQSICKLRIFLLLAVYDYTFSIRISYFCFELYNSICFAFCPHILILFYDQSFSNSFMFYNKKKTFFFIERNDRFLLIRTIMHVI